MTREMTLIQSQHWFQSSLQRREEEQAAQSTFKQGVLHENYQLDARLIS